MGGVIIVKSLSHYRHTLFYCTLLYCASQIIAFLQIEGLWQPCVEQAYWYHFLNSIFSLCVSVSYFGNFSNNSNFFIIMIFVMVICDH